MGLMAMHILSRRERPVFFYRQHYMGAFEAYCAAPLFRMFGASVTMLRLPLVCMYALFLLSTYLLRRLLYTRRLALVTLGLLCLGSPDLLFRQVEAIGGYPETLLCGSLVLLLAAWLVLTHEQGRAR